MQQPDTEIDLDALTDAIVASIAAQFPEFVSVDAYREAETNLQTPACLIELDDLEPQPDIGTEQLAVMARFSGRVVLGMRDPDVRRATPKFAAALALHINRQRWAQPVAPAEVIGIQRDDFDPRLDQFEVWVVEWQQVIHLGASVWGGAGDLPTQLLGAWHPEIGPDHEGSYEEITVVTV